MNNRKSIFTLSMATLYLAVILLFTFSSPLSNKFLKQNTPNCEYVLGVTTGIPCHIVINGSDLFNVNWNLDDRINYKAQLTVSFINYFLALKGIAFNYPELLSNLQSRLSEILFPFHSFW